ncbi:MAG: ECF transporter S component [Oscillospiraceae bacterium]|nr:ECF transporter S component [Oscillospiraceae bacterium]
MSAVIMRKTVSERTRRLVGVAMFAAVIVVVQTLTTFVWPPGTIPINLVLPAIVVGAALYGTKAGMFLGLCFSAVVIASGITGAAGLSNLMWIASPVLFILVTLVRGASIGLVAGIVFSAVSQKDTQLGVLVAAVLSPVVNTGIFLLSLIFLFRDVLRGIAGENNIIYHAFIVMAGTNFIVELAVNIGLVTATVIVITATKKNRNFQ